MDKTNPFNWGFEETDRFYTNAELRDAQYTEHADETFIYNERESFMDNADAPTPQLANICGISCPNKD